MPLGCGLPVPEPELAGRRVSSSGYAVRHPDGGVSCSTPGSASATPSSTRPTTRTAGRSARCSYDAGIDLDDVTAVANCHLHADHAGQNGAFRVAASTSSRPSGSSPTRPTTRSWSGSTPLERTPTSSSTATTRSRRHPDRSRRPATREGHQSLASTPGAGTVVLAGQACYTVGEWDGAIPTPSRVGAARRTQSAYDASIERLASSTRRRLLRPRPGRLDGADPARPPTPAILPGPC